MHRAHRLAYKFRWVGIRFRAEFLYPAVKTLGDIKVAFRID